MRNGDALVSFTVFILILILMFTESHGCMDPELPDLPSDLELAIIEGYRDCQAVEPVEACRDIVRRIADAR